MNISHGHIMLVLIMLGPWSWQLAQTASAQTVDLFKLKKCMASIASNVSLSAVCEAASDKRTSAPLAVGTAVEDYVATCLELESFRALRILVPNTTLLPSLYKLVPGFESFFKVPVVLNAVDVGKLNSEVLQQLGLQDFSDGWIVDPSVTGDLVGQGGVADLTGYVSEDPKIAWSDVTTFFRRVSAIFDDKIIGVPLDGDQLLLYYRRDLFDAHNLTVPATWDEMVDIAVRMNGTDTDGDGQGDLYGACIDTSPTICKASFVLSSILAPYVQYNGTQQGLFINPKTMEPLMDNEAMRRTVDHYTTLFRYSPPLTTCSTTNPHFRNGRCLMTINFGDEFKANAYQGNGSNRSASWLGVARLPGSPWVLNRTTGQLLACRGTDVCPYAELVTLANGSTAWVNYAPYSAFGGWTGMVNARADTAYQKLAYRFFSFIAQPNNSQQAVLDPTSGLDPFRVSQLSVWPEGGVTAWVQAGYDPAATRSYLDVVNQVLASGNVVLDIRLQYLATPVRGALISIALNTTFGQDLQYGDPNMDNGTSIGADNDEENIASVLAEAQSYLVGQMQGLDMQALQKQYCQLIGCPYGRNRGAVKVVVKTSQSVSGGGLSRWKIALVAVLVPVGTLLLGAALGLLLWRRVLGHRNLLHGLVRPPGAGPQTTLVITDIQDSTSLWEALPEDVMDAALRTHHAVVRKALARHNGYESATEGDSFILAFHTADDAVACALRIQTQLLSAPWQQPLLRCADCDSAGEVWMVPARGTHYGSLLEMLGGTASELQKHGHGQHQAEAPEGGRRRCRGSSSNSIGGGGGGVSAVGFRVLHRAPGHNRQPPAAPSSGKASNSGVLLLPPPLQHEEHEQHRQKQHQGQQGLAKRLSLRLLTAAGRKVAGGSDEAGGGLPGAAEKAGSGAGDPGWAGALRGDSGHGVHPVETGADAGAAPGARAVEGQSQGHVPSFARQSTASGAGDEDWGPTFQQHRPSTDQVRETWSAALSTKTTASGFREGGRSSSHGGGRRRQISTGAGAGSWLRGLFGFGAGSHSQIEPLVEGASPGEEQGESHPGASASLKAETALGGGGGGGGGGAHTPTRAGSSQLLRDCVRAAWVPAGGGPSGLGPLPPPLQAGAARPSVTPRATEVDVGGGLAPLAEMLGRRSTLDSQPPGFRSDGQLTGNCGDDAAGGINGINSLNGGVNGSGSASGPNSTTNGNTKSGRVVAAAAAVVQPPSPSLAAGASSTVRQLSNPFAAATAATTAAVVVSDSSSPVLNGSPPQAGAILPSLDLKIPGRSHSGAAAAGAAAAAAAAATQPSCRTEPALQEDAAELHMYAGGGVNSGVAGGQKAATAAAKLPQPPPPPSSSLVTLSEQPSWGPLAPHNPHPNHQQPQKHQPLSPAKALSSLFTTGTSGLGAATAPDDGAAGAGAGGGGGGGGGGSGAQGLRTVCSLQQSALRQLAFRGLRVRMGIHSGVPTAADVLYNQAEARYHYSGAGMALARGVQGAAAGGQVLLSDATFALIRNPRAMKRLRGLVVLHMGEHLLDARLPASQQLYQALPRQLLCRLPLLPPLKVIRTLSAGALDAPIGRVAVAFLTAVGTATLLAWNSDVARRALDIFQEAFAAEAAEHAPGGAYIVEATSGLMLAAFASAADALCTCRSLQQSLLLADWPQELLEHEMCEQVTTVSHNVEGTLVRELLFRGLRVKGGIDWGTTRAALNGATGRIAYRGRVMNRAARISSQASSGQVLCSRAAWQAASEAVGPGGLVARGLTALSLGSVMLKGVSEPIEILEVRASVTATSAAVLGGIVLGSGSFQAGPCMPHGSRLAAAAAAASQPRPAGSATLATMSLWMPPASNAVASVDSPAAAAAADGGGVDRGCGGCGGDDSTTSDSIRAVEETASADDEKSASEEDDAARHPQHQPAQPPDGDDPGDPELPQLPLQPPPPPQEAAPAAPAAPAVSAQQTPRTPSSFFVQQPATASAAPTPGLAPGPAAGGLGLVRRTSSGRAARAGATARCLVPGSLEAPSQAATARTSSPAPAHLQVFRLDAATGIAAPEPLPSPLSPAVSLPGADE